MYEGDLVMLRYDANLIAPHTQKYEGKVGIVTDRRARWPGDERDAEMIVEVLYPELGIKEEWSEYDLEVVSEGR